MNTKPNLGDVPFDLSSAINYKRKKSLKQFRSRNIYRRTKTRGYNYSDILSL